ncbi:MAG: family peptidase, partial [Nevskia sp.]|nr:family peptidase [Nevskia sp.]
DVFNRTLTAYPRYAPAILEYAEALINTGSPDQARQILLSHDQALGTRVDTYRLLATAARATGNIAEAQYQQAEYLSRRGDLRGAIEQLNAGLRVASINGDDRARLIARRQELLNSIPRDELERLQKQG